MNVGVLGEIEKLNLYKAYSREGIEMRPMLEVLFHCGNGFYMVFDTNQEATLEYKKFKRIQDLQNGGDDE